MPKFNSKTFSDLKKAIAVLGEEQALADLNLGYGQRMYRKERNGEIQERMDLVKRMEKDPRYAQLVKEIDAKQAAAKKIG